MAKVYGKVRFAMIHPTVTENLIFVHRGKSSANATEEMKERKSMMVSVVRVRQNGLKFRHSFKLPMSDASFCSLHPQAKFLAVSHKNTICIVNGGKKQSYDSTPTTESFKACYTVQHSMPITAMDISPNGFVLATGDSRGQINQWAVNSDTIHMVVKQHWHAQCVRALNFSVDGEYLYSGGDEGVLVTWQLETGHRQFLPRMGSAIEHISIPRAIVKEDIVVNNVVKTVHTADLMGRKQVVALAMSNNSIKLIDSVAWSVEQTVVGLSYPKSVADYNHPLLNVGLKDMGVIAVPRNDQYNPLGNVVCMSAEPGVLQFWDHAYGVSVMIVQVSETVRVRKNDAGLVSPAIVLRVSFSSEAKWMATVEKPSSDSQEVVLKFWKMDTTLKTYVLDTRADRPHTDEITRVVFNEADRVLTCVTTSKDLTFKIWNLKQSVESRRRFKKNDIQPMAWSCSASVKWRDNVAVSDACFSEDGSVLVVMYGDLATVWDPVSLTFAHVLPRAYPKHVTESVFHHATFLKTDENSEMLLTWSSQGVAAYDILSGTVSWSLDFGRAGSSGPSLVQVVNQMDASEKLLLLMDIPSPKSESTHRHLVEVNILNGECSTIHSHKQFRNIKSVTSVDKERFVFMNDKFELMPYTSAAKVEEIREPESAPISKTQSSAGMFSNLFGSRTTTAEGKSDTPPPSVEPVVPVLKTDKARQWYDDNVSAHAMPPVVNLFGEFFQTILKPRVKMTEIEDAIPIRKRASVKPEKNDRNIQVTTIKCNVYGLSDLLIGITVT